MDGTMKRHGDDFYALLIMLILAAAFLKGWWG
jgi:hypothetical protein